ncbi:MAG: OmpA family protein [Bryobacterales bacterium]|nr:OmpA family protein [Bryobacterales bacterium]
MFRSRVVHLVAASLLATSLLVAQGNETTATKDDWEEINFEFDSYILSDGYPTLLRLAELLKMNQDYRVQVEGHTDYVGSVAYNERLALNRAEAVKSFLVKYGASGAQLQTGGQGKAAPKVPNTSKEGRFMNRRVTLTVRDGQGNIVAAGGAAQVVPALEERLQKLEECCASILKKLDKLDDILAALRDLKGENERLKQDVAALKSQERPAMAAAPAGLSAGEAREIAREAVEELDSRNKKFSILSANLGPTTYGDLAFSGKGRYFAPFKDSFAVQAEGEYMYYGGGSGRIEGRQEGQFDLGLVSRAGNFQLGQFASFKRVQLSQFQQGGTLGQAALTADWIFSRGRIGAFGTKGFLSEATVNRTQLGPNSFTESYLSIVDQAGGSAAVAAWGDAWFEGNLGHLWRRGGDNRPGGMIRLVQPLNKMVALTFEAGMNETLITNNDRGRFQVGLQFGQWLTPKMYGDTKGPVPVDIPRVRYEVLTRRVGNSTPVADAGPDQIGVAPGQITLDGSGSYDPDGDPLTYEWRQIAGPSVSIAGMSEARATFTAAEGQSYSFRLTVRDPGGLTGTARATVSTRTSVQPRILRFNAQPNVIRAGQTTTLIWQVENAESVEITGLGNVDPQSGTSTITPDQTTTYRLTARNQSGEISETITVAVEREGPRILRFLATPATILPGEASTLAWETENADSVEILGIGTVRPDGATTVSPASTTTYTLIARSRFGEVTTTATVQVIPGQAPRIIRFAATPVEILPTEQASLVWQVENADEVTISGIGRVEATGTSTVSPTANTTYTITARNAQGEVSSTAVVGVIAPVRILDFVADPPQQVAGQPVTLKWTTQNATEVVITGVGAVPANGSVTVTPDVDTSYTLIAYGQRTQASAFALVKIVPPPATNRPPVADAGDDQRIYRNVVVLDGSRSFDPDSDPITFSWRLVQYLPDPNTKPGPTTPTLTNTSTARPTVLMPQWGQYVFELTVTDSHGARATDYVRVTFIDP